MVINELPIGMYLQNEYNNLRYRETNIDGQNRVREVQIHIYKSDIKYGHLKQKSNYIKFERVKSRLDAYSMIICH